MTVNAVSKKEAINIYKHYFYFAIYNHFHENYSSLYKFNPSNVRLITEEIKDYFKEDNQNYSQINFMLEELFYTAQQDPIFVNSFYTCQSIIKEIKSNLEHKNYDSIQRNIKTLDKELNYNDKYQRRLQGFLSSFLLDKFFKEAYLDSKENTKLFLDVTNCFVAELQSKYSRKYIDYLRSKLLENNRDFESGFNFFVGLLFFEERKYLIKFKVKFYQLIPSTKQSDGSTKFHDYLNKAIQDCREIIFDEKKQEYEIILEKISPVRDFFILSKNIKIDLATVFDGFLFEYNTFRIELYDDVEAKDVTFGQERKWECFQFERAESHVNPNKDSFLEKLSEVLNGNTQLDTDTRYRIKNSLRYYSAYLHENEEDKKLLHLWIATENLFRNLSNNQETFSKIKTTLVQLSIIYNAREYCDELQGHIIERGKSLQNEDSEKYQQIVKRVEERNKGVFNIVGICTVLSDSPEEIVSLFNSVRNNFYTGYKYNSLSKVFKRSKTGLFSNLYSELIEKERTVSWRIARIYRKRNQIVHGHNPGDLKVRLSDLISLEYFYHLTMEALVDFVTSDYYKTDSMIEFLDKINRTKNEYINLIKSSESLPIKDIVLPKIVV